MGELGGLGHSQWFGKRILAPQEESQSHTEREGFPAPSSYREQGSQHTGRSRGPCDVLGTGETGAGGRQSGRSPGERLEVEHVRFSFSAPTVTAGCVGAGISQLDARSGAARAGDTVGRGDTIPRKKKNKNHFESQTQSRLRSQDFEGRFSFIWEGEGVVHYRQLSSFSYSLESAHLKFRPNLLPFAQNSEPT